MSVNFIIGGVLVFVIGIIIGIVCSSNESLLNKIDSLMRERFSRFENHFDYQAKNTNEVLCNLSRIVADSDRSNVEKNKNTQLDRVIKIIAEELKKA